MTARPLDDVLVIEWSSLACGPFAGKWLAEAGADVIKIEAPDGGDEARRRGPFPGDQPDPERSALFLVLNTNKRSVTLDPTTADGMAILRRLLERADVLLHDRPPAEAAELGLDYESLAAEHERLVVTAISNYGGNGPRRDEHAYPLNVVHAAGVTYHQLAGRIAMQRFPDGGPVKPGSFIAEFDAGLQAAIATLAALLARMTTGRGQHVDVSKQWALASTQRPEVSRYPSDGTLIDRTLDTEWFSGVYECKDGWVVIGAIWGARNWASAVEMLGNPDFAHEPWFKEDLWNLPQLGIPQPDHVDEIRDVIQAWCLERTRAEIQEIGQSHNLTITGHRSLEEVLASEHLRVRGFLRDIEHPEAGTQPDTAFPFRTSTIDSRRAGPAPRLGEHNREVYCDLLGLEPEHLPVLRQAGAI